MAYVPTLKTKYKEQIKSVLMKEFGYTSIMQCPKLTKIVINQGMGCLLYTSPSPRDGLLSRMPSSA